MNEAAVIAFFNNAISTAWQPGDHVVGAQVNHEKQFTFLELRTPELADAVLKMDGIEIGSATIRIKRPKDYNAATAPPLTGPPIVLRLETLGIISPFVPDGPNKIFMGEFHVIVAIV